MLKKQALTLASATSETDSGDSSGLSSLFWEQCASITYLNIIDWCDIVHEKVYFNVYIRDKDKDY